MFTNQIREKVGVMFGSPETQPGGRALKFYASQRLDIRRIETLKDGTEAVGNRVRVKVVKNKVAAPFRQAEFDIEFGKGISTSGCILDLGIEHSIVTKSGSFFSYGDERLGQGRNNAKGYLDEHPEVAKEIEGKIYEIARRQPGPRDADRGRPGGRRGPGGRRVAVDGARAPARRPRRRAVRRGAGSRSCARQEAFDVAWRFLGHRDRTEAEVRRTSPQRVEPELVEEVVAELLEGGYVDDAAFARRFAEDRRNLDGWGGERIERRLTELGVDRSTIRAALAARRRGGARRARRPRASCSRAASRCRRSTPRDRERALGFLVRKGYELELAHDALRRHAAAAVEN